jgi:hypothetical protein
MTPELAFTQTLVRESGSVISRSRIPNRKRGVRDNQHSPAFVFSLKLIVLSAAHVVTWYPNSCSLPLQYTLYLLVIFRVHVHTIFYLLVHKFGVLESAESPLNKGKYNPSLGFTKTHFFFFFCKVINLLYFKPKTFIIYNII